MKQVQGTSLLELLVSLLILSLSTLPLVLAQWRILQSLHASELSIQALISINNMSEQLLSAHATQPDDWRVRSNRASDSLSVECRASRAKRLRLLFYWPKVQAVVSHCKEKNSKLYECMTREL